MKNFVETKLQTKFGDFIFRVYADSMGQETAVLFTENMKPDEMPTVRVHSECMTGDTFGSLRCDCGEQLEQSLRLISENGNGALVYLRQEGRGIGLFEKVRSYQLQHQGYDTFEANVMLGHGPDERTYEWAKTALQDLGIKELKLITNNPSKISEMAKLGFEVVERIPMVVGQNAHNQRYFEAKKDKFKHFFHQEISYYFYQFHVDSVEQVEEIGNFLMNKKRDPLLKICIGVSANKSTLGNKEEIQKIQTIFNACKLYEGFVPILHYSFQESTTSVAEIEQIKDQLPFVEYLQTNDLLPDDLEAIKKACEYFLADIPLSDENFHLVDTEVFRDLIKKEKAFLLLDNSKGRGVRETKEKLMVKIEKLLGYGLNDIAIFGGFGPDDLDTYFELRRYYKINFSIDAESKLKSGDVFDMDKAKVYLSQLLRFDDPKQASIDQTNTFLNQSKTDDWTDFTFGMLKFKVHPAVFNPSEFPSTKWFAEEMMNITINDTDFCEIGCGAGLISCYIADSHKQVQITSSDINPFASETTQLNVEENGLEKRIDVFNGDVFDGIPSGRKFNSIFWSLPFGFLDPGKDVDYIQMQVFDPGYRATRKFLSEGSSFLKEGGALYLGFSEDLGHIDLLKEIVQQNGAIIEVISQKEMKEEEVVTFQILKVTYSS
ncbi:MAG: GTP cyclohydrolase II [Flavobacteriaceae bacterium]|jgi:GTP cyclohydrolase II